MKKEFLITFLLLLATTLVLAETIYPQITVKMDMDKRILLRFVDPDTGDVEEYKPTVENYAGVAVTNLVTTLPEVSLLVYLMDEEGNVGNPAEIGPFPSNKDIPLDYRNGVLKELELNPGYNGGTTTETTTTETTTPGVITETTETTTATTETTMVTAEATSPSITGNAVVTGSDTSGLLTGWKKILFIIVILAIFVALGMYYRKQKLLREMPEEKELLTLRKREEAEKKALIRMKTEEKLREEIAQKKKEVQRRLAVEEAEMTQITKEGILERKKEAERFDKRTGIDNGKKGSFY